MKITVPKTPRDSSKIRKILISLIVVSLSFLAGLYGKVEIKSFFTSAIDSVNSEVLLYQPNSLETIFLDIPFDSLSKIQEKRSKALEIGVLLTSDDDFVPADMHLGEGGANIRIKLRLKGDWVDHLKGDKWSFRIHITENDESVLGMRKFSIQAPETRSFIGEWGYHQNLMQEGILTTRYEFVNVVLNGEYKGIYALEESFTQDLLESQGRREGIIFRMDEALFWERISQYNADKLVPLGASIKFFDYFLRFEDSIAINELNLYNGNRILSNEVLSAEKDTAFDLVNSFSHSNLDPDQVFDEEAWGKFFAISDLWAASHAERWHNLRFYYNPINGKIEPVAFDGNPVRYLFDSPIFLSEEPESFFFDNPKVQKAYIQTLERIITPNYLAQLENSYGEEAELVYANLRKEYWQGHPYLNLPWEFLNARGKLLAKNLEPLQIVRGGYALSTDGSQDWIELDLINLLDTSVVFDSITLGDRVMEVDPDWCASQDCSGGGFVFEGRVILKSGLGENYLPVSFKVPITDLGVNVTGLDQISVTTNILGGSFSVTAPLLNQPLPDFFAQSPVPQTNLEDALSRHAFLTKISENQLAVLHGDWIVEEDLIIPEGYRLNISGGTTLRFDQDKALISYSPLVFLGEEDNPILLTAEEQSWSGVVVLSAEEESRWEYVKVEKTESIDREGWILTGGVTFYKSPVTILRSVFENAFSEDALNIVSTRFELDQVEFSSTVSDGFDGDFTSGEVIGCSFHDIAGDGFDVSGSEVSISDSTFVNIQDKAVSAGENSIVSVTDSVIRSVWIGIASKDLSVVMVNGLFIEDAQNIGLAAYIKKPQYGPAEIIAEKTEILNTQIPTVCQIGSTIELNSVILEEQEFDVDQLYGESSN